jgi:hypothetical protein
MPILNWGADTQISLPNAPTEDLPMLVDLGGSGFGFTAGGICHNVTEAQLEELRTPFFAPPMTTETR